MKKTYRIKGQDHFVCETILLSEWLKKYCISIVNTRSKNTVKENNENVSVLEKNNVVNHAL